MPGMPAGAHGCLRCGPLSLALVLSGLAGCTSDDEPSTETEGATAATSTLDASGTDSGPADSSGGPAETGEGTADGDTTEGSTGEPPPAEPAIQWVGRYDTSDPASMRAGWSGAGFVVRFDGTGASVVMDDAARYHTVLVDGVVQPTLATFGGEQTYVLATGLPAGEHTVELYRRTEGSFGPTVIHEVQLEGELLAPPPVTRRMEIVGDSITAGYGNEGISPCSFSAETENHYLTYGAIAARAVGAELHTVAWSGKGIIYNYGDDVFEPLPEVYDRTVASEGAAYDYAWQPDVVAVNLGTNDFSTDNDPSQELFVSEYVAFLGHLRDVHPGSLLLVLNPSLYGDEATMVEGYLMEVVSQRQAAGDADVAYADVNVTWLGSGCDGHPDLATHAAMGERLTQELQSRLGW